MRYEVKVYQLISHEDLYIGGEVVYIYIAHVTDLINRIVQVLRGDLYWFKISAQDAELMEPVELWDEG